MFTKSSIFLLFVLMIKIRVENGSLHITLGKMYELNINISTLLLCLSLLIWFYIFTDKVVIRYKGVRAEFHKKGQTFSVLKWLSVLKSLELNKRLIDGIVYWRIATTTMGGPLIYLLVWGKPQSFFAISVFLFITVASMVWSQFIKKYLKLEGVHAFFPFLQTLIVINWLLNHYY